MSRRGDVATLKRHDVKTAVGFKPSQRRDIPTSRCDNVVTLRTIGALFIMFLAWF